MPSQYSKLDLDLIASGLRTSVAVTKAKLKFRGYYDAKGIDFLQTRLGLLEAELVTIGELNDELKRSKT